MSDRLAHAARVALAALALAALAAPAALPGASGGVRVTSASEPRLVAVAPIVILEAGLVSGCVAVPNAHATGASVVAEAAAGNRRYDACFGMRNTLPSSGSSYASSIRLLSSAGLARVSTLVLSTSDGSGATIDHVVVDRGVVVQSEPAAWQTVSGGSLRGVDLRLRVTSGALTTLTCEVLVARPGATGVYAAYPLTLAIGPS